jgi:hypothetical protein
MMRSLRVVLVLTLAAAATAALAQPDVTGVEGAAQSGRTFRLFGADFGTKARPGPLRWDDFQDGALGARLQDFAEGGQFNLQAAETRRPTYSDGRQRFPGDVSALQDYSERNNKGMMVLQDFERMYATFWAYRDDYAGTAMDVTNCKLFGNFYNGVTGVPESRWDEYWFNGTGHLQMNDCNASNVGNNWVGSHPYLNQWIRVERYFDYGDPGQPNGYAYGMVNGEMIGELNGVFRTNACADDLLGGFVMGNYFRTEDGSGALLRQYISEMYVDTTLARVEIGDDADWNRCSKREIQLPTAWINGVVSIEFNSGSFQAGDQAYAFVVDRDGNASAGYPFVVGTDYGTGGNISPVAVNDQAATGVGEAVVIDVLTNDGDADGSLDVGSLSVTSGPAHGSVVLGIGSVTYTPDAGFSGTDTFTYTVRDNEGALSNTATVTIQVTAVDLGPPGPPGRPFRIQ